MTDLISAYVLLLISCPAVAFDLDNPITATDLEWDVVEEHPAKDFEGCETVSIAENAQCSLVECPAQLVNHEPTRILRLRSDDAK